jgi:hypothetical protein
MTASYKIVIFTMRKAVSAEGYRVITDVFVSLSPRETRNYKGMLVL